MSARLAACFFSNSAGGKADHARGSSVVAPHQPARSRPLKSAVKPLGGTFCVVTAPRDATVEVNSATRKSAKRDNDRAGFMAEIRWGFRAAERGFAARQQRARTSRQGQTQIAAHGVAVAPA